MESILESPDLILRKQLDRAKGLRLQELKAAGVEYDERMEELEKVEWPKPRREFIYETFNEFAEKHPWVGGENIRPKSIAREMYELYLGFGEYVREYEIQRAEGLLLRYLSDVYKTLGQTVPAMAKTEAIDEIEAYFGSMLRAVDSSLVAEWERMRNPAAVAPIAAVAAAGATDGLIKNSLSPRERTAKLRNEAFQFLRLLARQAFDEASASLANADEWPPARIASELAPFFEARGAILTAPDARRTEFTEIKDGVVTQRLVDPEGANDWNSLLRSRCRRSRVRR